MCWWSAPVYTTAPQARPGWAPLAGPGGGCNVHGRPLPSHMEPHQERFWFRGLQVQPRRPGGPYEVMELLNKAGGAGRKQLHCLLGSLLLPSSGITTRDDC